MGPPSFINYLKKRKKKSLTIVTHILQVSWHMSMRIFIDEGEKQTIDLGVPEIVVIVVVVVVLLENNAFGVSSHVKFKFKFIVVVVVVVVVVAMLLTLPHMTTSVHP